MYGRTQRSCKDEIVQVVFRHANMSEDVPHEHGSVFQLSAYREQVQGGLEAPVEMMSEEDRSSSLATCKT